MINAISSNPAGKYTSIAINKDFDVGRNSVKWHLYSA